jgi:hypothetical protein
MDFMQTKCKDYVVIDQHCVAKVIAIAEKDTILKKVGFRVYVVWEWKACADKGLFGFTKSRAVFPVVTEKIISETMRFGFDIGGTEECKELFKDILE